MATTKWHHYLQGHHFIIKTDHQSLKYLLEQRLSTMLQQKWIAKLLGIDYKIVYKKTTENRVVDALSRLPETNNKDQVHSISIAQLHWLQEVVNIYDQDVYAQEIITQLSTGDEDNSHWQYVQGLLKHQGKIYVGISGDIRRKLIHELHDGVVGGHSGQEATLRRIKQFFFWPAMKNEVTQYIQECDTCQRVKTGHQFPRGLLQPLPVPNQIWEDISIEFIEGLPKSLHKDCIMVVIDRFTKVGHFIALTHPFTATPVAQLFLDNIFKLHDMSRSIVSYRDKIFTSLFWKELLTGLGTQLCMSSAYHPHIDGKTERLNRCLGHYLRAMESSRPKNWCKWLPLAQWWYNTTYHSAINRSPYEALYGVCPRQICIPTEHRSKVDVVAEFQIQRETMNKVLQEDIQVAQHKYNTMQIKREVRLNSRWVILFF